MQNVGPTQVTPDRKFAASPGGPAFGLETIDHLVPFHVSTRVLAYDDELQSPTAVHAAVDEHETPDSEDGYENTFGDDTIDQDAPFHNSVKVCVLLPFTLPALPTAMQALEPEHETPENEEVATPGGFTLGSRDQELPFQNSAKVLVGVMPFCVGPVARAPTATHAVGPEHEMPLRILRPDHAPGSGVMDHVEPFHISAKGTVGPDWPPLKPTARQSEVETQLTPSNPAFVEPAGLGEGTIDHDDPSQLSAKVDAPVVPELLPTATQKDDPIQATPPKLVCSALDGLGFGLVVQMGAVRPDAEANVAGTPIMPIMRAIPTLNSTASRIMFVRTLASCRRKSVPDRGQSPRSNGQDCLI